MPSNLLLVNMKPVDNEKAVIMQLREIGGKETAFSIKSDVIDITGITVCDVTGESLKGGQKPVFSPWENKFIKLTWR